MSAGEARQRSSEGKMLDHVNRYTDHITGKTSRTEVLGKHQRITER